ncbi:MAG: ADP-ribose pyrophosphatase [Deltaproteobacteria bacterium HGW-Deltaproteobacteria-6]|jgi:ADP-ribose pyrophosphatase|nr:MAG: ADP-ribose pyrophosphatase [Deltaproteobacteria bacterium HGW-Deltaproteobacteria-6]
MENNKKLSYSCKIFSVWEEDISLPNGKTIKQSWIDHKPTVAVIPVNDKNELLLIKQFRIPAKQNLLEIPAGSMDHGEESPVACAGRELAEETGYRARSLTQLFAGYLLPGYCNEFMYFFLAQDLAYAPLTPDEDEFIEVIPVSFKRAEELINSGAIMDAKTVLGIMLAGKFL